MYAISTERVVIFELVPINNLPICRPSCEGG